MGLYFSLLKYMGWFRISELEEFVGLDISRHKGSAYEMEKGVAADSDVKMLENSRLDDRSNSRHGAKNAVINDTPEPEKESEDDNDA
jgi:ammonium transporter, Amt family